MKQKIAFVCLCFTFLACKNELEVYSDGYRETAVVYGLIDQGQPQQFIRVNKTYRTAGNASDGLALKDSLRFENIEVWLTALAKGRMVKLAPVANGSSPDVFMLDDVSFPLTDSLRLDIINPAGGSHFSSVTRPINPPSITSKGTLIAYGENLVSFSPSPGGFVYDLYVRLSYSELVNNTMQLKTADYFVRKNMEVLNPVSSGDLWETFSGAEMIPYLRDQMGNGNGLYRKLNRMQIMVTGGTAELKNYIQQFVPSKTIVQKNTQFSNITGGLGIFSSRGTDISVSMQPDSSLRKLFKNSLNLD